MNFQEVHIFPNEVAELLIDFHVVFLVVVFMCVLFLLFSAIRFSCLLGAKTRTKHPNVAGETSNCTYALPHNNKLVNHSIANTHRPLREARAERVVPPFASTHTYPLGTADRPAARIVFRRNRSSTIAARNIQACNFNLITVLYRLHR